MSSEIYILWQQNPEDNIRNIVGAFKDKKSLQEKIDQLRLVDTGKFIEYADKNKKGVMQSIFGIEIVNLEGEESVSENV